VCVFVSIIISLASNNMVISEEWTEKDVEGIGHIKILKIPQGVKKICTFIK